MKLNPCDIHIEIDESGGWRLTINEKEILYPKRFSIELNDSRGGCPSFTLETYAGLYQ